MSATASDKSIPICGVNGADNDALFGHVLREHEMTASEFKREFREEMPATNNPAGWLLIQVLVVLVLLVIAGATAARIQLRGMWAMANR